MRFQKEEVTFISKVICNELIHFFVVVKESESKSPKYKPLEFFQSWPFDIFWVEKDFLILYFLMSDYKSAFFFLICHQKR